MATIAGIAALLTACGGGAGEDAELSAPLRADVAEQCSSEGFASDLCACVVDTLEVRFSGSELEQIAARVADPAEEPPAEATATLRTCSQELGYDAPGGETAAAAPPEDDATTDIAGCAERVRTTLAAEDATWMDPAYDEAVCETLGDDAVTCVGAALQLAVEYSQPGLPIDVLGQSLLATCVVGPGAATTPIPPVVDSSPLDDLRARERERELDQLQRDFDDLQSCIDHGISC